MTLGLKFFSGVAKLIIFICTGTWELSITPEFKKKKKKAILPSFFTVYPLYPQKKKNKRKVKKKN